MKKLLGKLKVYIQPFLNWRFAVTYFIVWSWHLVLYAGIAIGLVFKIKWLYSTCLGVYAFLWTPWCNENLFQIPLAILLHTKLFKNDLKTRAQLDKLYDEAKQDWNTIKSKFKRHK